jgi:hypothetical protein
MPVILVSVTKDRCSLDKVAAFYASKTLGYIRLGHLPRPGAY